MSACRTENIVKPSKKRTEEMNICEQPLKNVRIPAYQNCVSFLDKDHTNSEPTLR